VAYLISNVPQFKCWVRKESTPNHSAYHGEYLHALVIAVNTLPDRSLSFQVVFTGCEIRMRREQRTKHTWWSNVGNDYPYKL